MKKILVNLCFIFIVLLLGMNAKANERYLVGNSAYVTFDRSIATISGTGDMFNFDEDGYDPSGRNKNPFLTNRATIVEVAEGITSIGNYTFYKNGIETINLPNSLRRVGSYSFTLATKLKNFVLPEGLIEIGDHAFHYAGYLVLPDERKPIKLPDTLKTIGSYAFANTNLGDLKLPSSLSKIADDTFSECDSITSVTFPPNLTEIGHRAFADCKNITTINLPENIHTIQSYAFKGCIELTDITVPGSMKTIGSNAFSGCRRLFSVTLSEGVQNIADNAFSGCIRLKSVTLPTTLQTIGDYAFSTCSMLKTLSVKNGAAYIGIDAFKDSPVTLVSSKGSNVEQYAARAGIPFQWDGTYAPQKPDPAPAKPKVNQIINSGSLTYRISSANTVQVMAPVNKNASKITIPNTVKLNTYDYSITSIAKEAFKNKKKLKNISIGKNITSIGDRAFYGCTALAGIRFNKNVKSIGKAAFRSCTNLNNVKLPSKVAIVNPEIFYGCRKLAKVTLGSNTVTVGKSAFSGCTRLKSVTLPSKVKSIGSKAFYNCRSLKRVTFKGTALRNVGSYALKKINSRAVIKVPGNRIKAYTKILRNKGQRKTVKISK